MLRFLCEIRVSYHSTPRQRRVERAQVRRQIGKQLKQKKVLRSHNKSLVAVLWQFIDQLDIKILDKSHLDRVHIWVDHRPYSQRNNDDDTDGIDGIDRDRKPKHNSKKGSPEVLVDNNTIPKKSHPRSHEHQMFDESVDNDPMLCRSFFFAGDCDGFRKGGKSKKGCYTCDRTHYSMPQRTLFDVLKNSKLSKGGNRTASSSEFESNQHATLLSASKAAALAQIDLEDDDKDKDMVLNEILAVDTVYHLEVPLSGLSLNDSTLSQFIIMSLTKEKVPSGSICYLALGNILIFDRYNGGFISSNHITSQRQSEYDTFKQDDTENGCNLMIHFPNTVLEMVILFLPNIYSGILPSVCKNWYHEIGCHSPNIWRNYNTRNGWPNPNQRTLAGQYPDASAKIHKSMFTLNYISCTRVKKLIRCSSNRLENSECNANLNTAHSLLPKSETNPIINMKFISETSIILGTQNGTIYMMQVSGQHEKMVSKIFGPIRIAPKPNAKRLGYRLKKIILDEKYVLFSFSLDMDSGIILSISKDDLLQYSSETVINCGPDETLRYNDLTAGFRDLCQRSENSDLTALRNYIETQKEYKIHIELKDHDIVPCGYGIFVAIIGYYTQDELGTEHSSHKLGLVSFSVISKGIFVIDFYRLGPLSDLLSNVSLVSNWDTKKKSEPTIIMCKETSQRFCVDKKGSFSSQNLSQEHSTDLLRKIVLLTSTLALSAKLTRSFTEEYNAKVAITVETLDEENRENSILHLPRYYCDLITMTFLGFNHILIICERTREQGDQIVLNQDSDRFIHFFQSDDGEVDSDDIIMYDFILIQVPELYIISVESEMFHKDSSILLDSIPKWGTAAALLNDCINIVGIQKQFLQVDDKFEDMIQIKMKKEKKKKRLSSKTEKKDAFARGMSFR